MSKENRKAFFDRIAASLHLDPGDPNTWYSITRDQVLKAKVSLFIFFSFFLSLLCFLHFLYLKINYTQKGGRGAMWYYNYSYVKAVTSIYPNIGLEGSKFSTPPSMCSKVNQIHLVLSLLFHLHITRRLTYTYRREPLG